MQAEHLTCTHSTATGTNKLPAPCSWEELLLGLGARSPGRFPGLGASPGLKRLGGGMT